MLISRVGLRLHHLKELLSGPIVNQRDLTSSPEHILSKKLAPDHTIYVPKQSTAKSIIQQFQDSIMLQELRKASKQEKN